LLVNSFPSDNYKFKLYNKKDKNKELKELINYKSTLFGELTTLKTEKQRLEIRVDKNRTEREIVRTSLVFFLNIKILINL